jgi:hypothetical protein
MTNSTNVTYVFSHTTLLEALKEWELEQVEHYPHQEERIQIASVAMQHFLRSQQVKDHKMIVSGEPNDFVIEIPVSIFDSEPEHKSKIKKKSITKKAK